MDQSPGVSVLATTLSAIIYGVTCMQAYLYYTSEYKRDKLFMRCYVGILFAADTFHVALLIQALYLVTSNVPRSTSASFYEIPWSQNVQIAVSGVVSSLSQYFYAYRSYRLGGRALLGPITISILSTAEIVINMFITIVNVPQQIIQGNTRFSCLVPATLVISAVCDCFITICTIWYLRKNRTAFLRTNQAIDHLIRYCFSTGFLTSIFAILALIMYECFDQKDIYLPFLFIMTRLYACSFLSILNTRRTVERKISGRNEITSLSTFQASTHLVPDPSTQIYGIERGSRDASPATEDMDRKSSGLP